MTQPPMIRPPASSLPPTRALYHEDGERLHFEAAVLAEGEGEVALTATAFYPEGGGQSSDRGELRWAGGRAEVTHARRDKVTGVIWHRLSGNLPPVGTEVSGAVDPDVRWRHMQRHSAEHLLAQAFRRVNPVFEVAAVSMTGPDCTIDFTGDPAEVHVRAAEALLRETLGRQRLTLETPIVPEAELPNYPLRRASKVSGQVRLVVFRDGAGEPFDVSACGGTHVPEAALCAPVVVLRTERIRGGHTRVVFRAGEEASEYLTEVYRAARTLAQDFSAPVEKLPERVAALRAERDAARGEVEALRAGLAASQVQAAPTRTSGPLTLRELTLEDAALLAPAFGAVPAGEVLAILAPGGRCGVASAVEGVHAGETLRAALAVTGGKGGGRSELAQGQTADPDGFLAAVRACLIPA